MTEVTQNKVMEIVANITLNQQKVIDVAIEDDEENESLKNTNITSNKNKTDAVRGKPKSGRFWKSQKERFSTINKTKGLRQNFEKKTALRLELKRTKEMSRQKLEDLKQKEVLRKERRRENIKRSEENKQKAEVVQVITNTAKLRRMRKKQLRFIEKRDTNKQIDASK